MSNTLLVDHNYCKWLDAEHSVFQCKYKTDISDWIYASCHKYSTGVEKTLWESQDFLEILPADDEATEEAVIALVQDGIQKMLDNIAKERLYDDAFSLVSYTTSTDPKFKAEAEKFNAYRDSCWRISWQIFDDYKAGNRPMPTYQEVMSELPEFSWDN